jgi:hypothetical protein
MSQILDQAKSFFEACETGKGWEGCSPYCHPDATFSAQAGALANIKTVEGYCDWMKGLFTPVPDGHYELKCFALDEARSAKLRGCVCRVSWHADRAGRTGWADGKHHSSRLCLCHAV